MEVGNEDSAIETNKITYLTLWKSPSFKQEMQTAKLQYLNLFEDETLSPEKKLAPKSCFNHSWCLHQHKQNPNHMNRDRIIILYSGQMLIMFKFVLHWFHSLNCTPNFLQIMWQVLTASDLRASSAQMWADKKWPLDSRNNYSRVCRKGAGKPSLEHAMGHGINDKTQRNRGTSEQCLTFLWLHHDRRDRKHR